MTQSKLRKNIQHFFRDDSGTNAIEFAFMFPFLLALLLFITTANDAVNASTEIGKVTVAVADILSQSPSITKETIDATFDAADLLVGDGRTARLELYVVGLEVLPDESVAVLWSRDNGNLTSLSKPSPGDNYTLPPEVLKRPGFIVSARARLNHTPLPNHADIGASNMEELGGVPLITKVISGDMTYDYESNFVPRSSIATTCDDCNN